MSLDVTGPSDDKSTMVQVMAWCHQATGLYLNQCWPRSLTIIPCPLPHNLSMCRDHFVYAPRQWETKLQCNIISHWLGTYTKWSLHMEIHWNRNAVISTTFTSLAVLDKMTTSCAANEKNFIKMMTLPFQYKMITSNYKNWKFVFPFLCTLSTM